MDGEGEPRGEGRERVAGPLQVSPGLAGGRREVEDGDGDDPVRELEACGPIGQTQQPRNSSVPIEGPKEHDGIHLCCLVRAGGVSSKSFVKEGVDSAAWSLLPVSVSPPHTCRVGRKGPFSEFAGQAPPACTSCRCSRRHRHYRLPSQQREQLGTLFAFLTFWELFWTRTWGGEREGNCSASCCPQVIYGFYLMASARLHFVALIL